MSTWRFEDGLAAAASGVRRGLVGSAELVTACFDHIEQWEPHIAALPHMLEERAMERAAQADRDVSEGSKLGGLHGVPIVVKDVIDVAGAPREAGSAVLAGTVASRNATVVERLEQAGAIVIAKSNTHEFAYGALTPPTRNPWDTGRMPGGSSGGSAAAVAAGEALGALGTDTAGSIREPAALCGVVGLKPTFGLVSCDGVVPLAWSLDVVGPMARFTDDCRLLLSAMEGPDPRDPSTVAAPAAPPAMRDPLRVAIVAELLDPLEPAVEEALRRVLAALEDSGAIVDEVELADPDEVVATIFVVLAAEASAYHRRTLVESPELLGDDVRSYLEMGMELRAADYVDAQRVRGDYASRIDGAFQIYDLLLSPAQHLLAPSPDSETVQFPGGRTAPRDLTLIRPLSLFSLSGHPAVSVPVAFSSDGLPIGIQLIGRPFADHDLLAVAGRLQEMVGWSPRLPELPGVTGSE